MYPKNAASPPTIAIGALINVSTGAVTTTGASVTVTPQGGSETAGGGTLACLGTSGIWQYTPTQAETNYTAFTVAVYESGCIPVAVTVVTSANSTAGYPGGVPAIAAGAKSGLPVLDSSTGLLLSGYGGGLVGMNVTEWNGTAVGGLPPTAAAIATAVWTDTTSGDFTTSGSAGKELLTTIPAAIAAIPTNPYTGTPPTAAAIATAVWQDTTAGDFGTSGSAGKELLTTIPAAIAAIPTNPYTGTPPTAAAIATAVWTDTTSGDFTNVRFARQGVGDDDPRRDRRHPHQSLHGHAAHCGGDRHGSVDRHHVGRLHHVRFGGGRADRHRGQYPQRRDHRQRRLAGRHGGRFHHQRQRRQGAQDDSAGGRFRWATCSCSPGSDDPGSCSRHPWNNVVCIGSRKRQQ